MSEAYDLRKRTVFFLGSDTALAVGLGVRVARAGLTLRGFRTVAGLMIGADTDPPHILILETKALAPGRVPERLVLGLRQATGLTPALVCLGETGSPGASQSTVLQPPFDEERIAAKLVELAAEPIAPRHRVLQVGESPLEDEDNAKILRQGGILVKRVCDETQIQSAVEQFAPDLALVDLDMALTAAKTPSVRIRDCPGCQDLPIVFLSSDSIQPDGVQARRIGGDDYLAKPVRPGVLLATVQAHLSLPPDSGAAVLRGTMVLNQIHFLQRLDQEIADWPNGGHGQAILYIQPDQQRRTPDTPVRGMDQTGFRAYLVERLSELALPGDRGAWLSDQGFALWVSRADDRVVAEFAESVLENISADLNSLAHVDGADPSPPSVSVGVGYFNPPADNAQTIISRAQAAFVQAETAAGSRVEVYRCLLDDLPADTGGASSTEPNDALLIPLLRRALEGDGFQLVYQPILPLRQVSDHRYEVLLRLTTPQGAIIPPLAFLPVVGRHGLLPALDRWVLSGALTMLRRERDAGRPTRFVIHQTLASLADSDWLDWVRGEILRLDLIRQRPILEFSAESILADEDDARLLFPELAKLGIEVCLSGVTVSEQLLCLLARRPIGCVKLARGMVARGAEARLKAATEAYRRRGARIIASGIEDPQTIGRVWSSGVDYIQGNFIQFPEATLHFDFHHAPTL